MYNAIKHLYPQATMEDFRLQDDGEGPYIAFWDTAKLGSQPTPEQIASATGAASKASMWEQIKAKRDNLSDTGGYSVLVNGVPKWFHSDAKSKTQQLSLVMMGAAVVNVPPWKTMDGSKVTMSQALAGQIFAAAVTKDGMLFAVAEAHRAAMEASATPETYDFSGGWPANYTP